MILEPKKIVCHWFHFLPIYFPWWDGTRCCDLCFGKLSFKPAFSFSSFTFIKRLLSSSSLSAIRVLSSAYLRLLILLLAISIIVSPSLLNLPHIYSPFHPSRSSQSTRPSSLNYRATAHQPSTLHMVIWAHQESLALGLSTSVQMTQFHLFFMAE